MARFLTVGYGDREGYERTDPAVRAAAHAADEQLVRAGAVLGTAGAPVQVRNHDGVGVQTTSGPFLRSALPVAGFGLLEADSLDEAVRLVAQSPCAVAQGVVEVWPLSS